MAHGAEWLSDEATGHRSERSDKCRFANGRLSLDAQSHRDSEGRRALPISINLEEHRLDLVNEARNFRAGPHLDSGRSQCACLLRPGTGQESKARDRTGASDCSESPPRENH